jgi:hypothetical protein
MSSAAATAMSTKVMADRVSGAEGVRYDFSPSSSRPYA